MGFYLVAVVLQQHTTHEKYTYEKRDVKDPTLSKQSAHS
jgi:hypothetical protein